MLRGILPAPRGRWLPEAVAGATPAALAGPEVLGYARIAGVPVAGMRRILAVRRAEFVVAMP